MTIVIRCEVPLIHTRRFERTVLSRAANWEVKPYRLVALQADGSAELLATHLSAYRGNEDIFHRRLFVNRWSEFYISWEVFYMPRTARNNTKDRAETPFATKGFLERRLSDNEIAQLDDWKPKPVEIFDHMAGMTHEGIKITLTFKVETGNGICTLTDNRAGSASEGYALSSFDSDCLLALKMAIFKHTAILVGDWSPLLTGSAPARRG